MINDKRIKSILLSDFFNVKRGVRLKQSDRLKGDIPLVTAGYQNDGIACYISNNQEIHENALTIDMFGNVFWRPYKFACDDNIIVLTHNLLNDSTAYYFLSAIKLTTDGYNYSHQYRIKDLNKHLIYVPVLSNDELDLKMIGEVSQILKKLYNSTESLIKELDKEVQDRTTQFTYYRRELLTFDNAEWLTINDVFYAKGGYTPSKSNNEFWENGTIPWFRMEDIRQNGRVLNDALQHVTSLAIKKSGLFPANSVMMATTATIGEHAMVVTDFLCNQQMTVLTIREAFKSRVLPKFVYHYCYIIDSLCLSVSNFSGGIPIVDQSKFKALPFPVPTIDEQKHIISVLDKYEELFNEIVKTLKNEIELRRKEFDFYQKKLLTFEE